MKGNGRLKLTEADVIQIRNARAAGGSTKEICQKFGITAAYMLRICYGHYWTHLPMPKELAEQNELRQRIKNGELPWTPLTVKGGYAVIHLNGGIRTKVDIEDWAEVARHIWHAHVDMNNKRGAIYAARKGERRLKLHVALMGRCEGKIVDHKNGDSLDNRRENLRFATSAQNTANAAIGGGKYSSYRGVRPGRRRSGRWTATVRHQGKLHYCGTYDTQEEAARARDLKAAEFFGEFARPNFPALCGQAVAK